MSTTVDTRIVQAIFDNDEFDGSLLESVKTLENFEKSLDSLTDNDALSTLNKEADKLDLSVLSNALQQVGSSFSALGAIGYTVLANLASDAYQYGKAILSSLTVEPVITGLTEYETKMNAIQTILTNTASKGTTLDDVVATLDELNTYADKTIYNFANMTSNIGTFTAAGVGLQDSADAIKGLSNLAAGTGANANQAASAMYQMSQALSQGNLMLMDYNSLVNAGMGGELFKQAAIDAGIATGAIKEGEVTLENFRDTLQDEWLSSELLLEIFIGFSQDEALTAAATEVKTLTQLFDTMKESVQSGWAQSWEIVIGNFEEAKGLFTDISNGFGEIAGATTDARNALLQGWKDLGGRDILIEGLAEAWTALVMAVEPIQKAFENIFPPTTIEELVGLTEGFKNLMISLQLSEETANNLERTFSGVFAIFDILGKIISSVWNEVAPLAIGLSQKLLGISASIGDFIVVLNDSLETMNPFGDAIAHLIDGFQRLLSLDFSNMSIDGDLSFFTEVGNLIQESFEPLIQVLNDVLPGFEVFASGLKTVFDWITSIISNFLQNITFDDVLDAIMTGSIYKLFSALTESVTSFTEIGEGLLGVISNFGGIFTELGNVLNAAAENIRADSIIKMATALAILAGSLLLISQVDSEKMLQSVAGIAALFTELAIAYKVLTDMGSGLATFSMVPLNLILLSVALGLLSTVLLTISQLDIEQISNGLYALAGILVELTYLLKPLIANTKGMITTAISLVVLAAAIESFSKSVELLANIDGDKVYQGLFAIGVVLTELGLFMKATKKSTQTIQTAVGLVILAGAISILADAIIKMSSVDAEGIKKSILAIGIILAELAMFMDVAGEAENMMTVGASLILVSIGLNALAVAMILMSTLSWDDMLKGLLGIAGGLLIISNVMDDMPDDMAMKALGLILVAGALNMMATAMLVMGAMSIPALAKSLIAMGGSLYVLSTGLEAMEGTLEGSAALMLASLALTMLLPPLVALSLLSFGQLIIGLLGLAGIFAVFGLAGKLLEPVIPTLLSLATVMLMMGGAFALTAAGALLLATAITQLLTIGVEGLGLLSEIIMTFINSIPAMGTAIGEGIIAMIQAIGGSANAIFEFVVTIIVGLCDALLSTIPKLLETLGTLLWEIIGFILTQGPALVASVIEIVLMVLAELTKQIGPITQAAVDLVLGFLAGITSKLPDIVMSAFNLIISFINGLADAIRTQGPAIAAAIGNLISAILEALVSIVTSFFQIGIDVVNGFINGISSMFQYAWNAVSNFFGGIVDGVLAFFGIHSPSRLFKWIANQDAIGFINGFTEMFGKTKNTMDEFGGIVVDSMVDTVDTLGDIGDEELSIEPKIVPVVDMTNVEQASSDINSLFGNDYVDTQTSRTTKTPSKETDETMKQLVDALNKPTDDDDPTPVEVTFKVEGDPKNIFKVVKEENDNSVKTTGKSPLVK